MTPSLRYSLLAAAVLGFAGTVQARDAGTLPDGYVHGTGNVHIRTLYGSCVRTGYWSPELATPECEGGAKKAQAEVPAQPERAPELVETPPAPAATTVAVEAAAAGATTAPQPTVISGEVPFAFSRSHLSAQASTKLDALLGELKLFQLEKIVVTGHADRIGGEAYNQRLAERRAASVKDYLVHHGIDAGLIETRGRGESEPVTAGACRNMGPENRYNRKLVECLQPDRRAGVEASGTRPQVSSR